MPHERTLLTFNRRRSAKIGFPKCFQHDSSWHHIPNCAGGNARVVPVCSTMFLRSIDNHLRWVFAVVGRRRSAGWPTWTTDVLRIVAKTRSQYDIEIQRLVPQQQFSRRPRKQFVMRPRYNTWRRSVNQSCTQRGQIRDRYRGRQRCRKHEGHHAEHPAHSVQRSHTAGCSSRRWNSCRQSPQL